MKKIGSFMVLLACLGMGCSITTKDIKKWEKEKNIAQLMTALDNKNSDISDDAIQSLANIGAPIVGPLIDSLKKEGSCVHGNKSKALGKITDPQAVSPLVSALRKDPPCIRATVALSLVNIGKPSVTPLIDVLKDKSLDVRKTAAKVLHKLDWTPENDLDRAYYAIATENWDNAYQLNAIAIEAFIDGLQYEQINRNISSVLGNMGERAVNPLVSQLKNTQIRRTAAWILSQIGEPAVGALIPVLQDGHTRQIVSWILYKIGEPAVKPLIASLNNPQFRGGAEDALVKLDKLAVEPLILALRDKDPGVRGVAATALGRIGDRRAIGPLTTLARGRDRRVRKAAVRALELIKR